MKALKYIFFFLCLYIYLYNPIFRVPGFGLIKILLLISFIYLSLNNGFNFLFQHFNKEILFTFLLIAYSLPLTLFSDGTAIMTPYQHFIWFLECFIIPIFLINYFKIIFNKYSFEAIFVIIGTVASLITLFLIINPTINLWLRQSVIIDTLDVIGGDWDFRGFSLSEISSYDYGIVQGFILAFCLFSLNKSFLYAIPIVPLFISIMFNARIGFSVVIISLVLLIIYKRLKVKVALIGVVLIYVSVFLYNNSSFVEDNSTTMEWGISFFEDTFSFLTGDGSDSNYETLSEDMFFFPDSNMGLIFGEGRSNFGAQNQSSDMGYVNQIFTGGIIYLLIMLIFIFYLYKQSLKYSTDKLIPTLFFISLIIVNIKGSAFFVPSGFFRLIIFYYIYSLSKSIQNSSANSTNISDTTIIY